MKVVELSDFAQVKVEWSDEERVNLRAWENGPYEIHVGEEWVRFVPGMRLMCHAKRIIFRLQEVVEFQLHCAWLTMSPGPDIGDVLEVV